MGFSLLTVLSGALSPESSVVQRTLAGFQILIDNCVFFSSVGLVGELISIQNSANVMLRDCQFNQLSTVASGMTPIYESHINNINSHHVFCFKAVVVVDSSANVAFVRCRFNNNSAASGSVLDIKNTQSLIYLVDTVFENNRALAESSGVISAQQTQLLMVSTIITTLVAGLRW